MHSCLPRIALAPLLPVAAASTHGGSAPCSHRNVTVGPNQPVVIPPTPYTDDCDGNGVLDCGFYTYEPPTIHVCDDPGTNPNHCCDTSATVNTNKIHWICDDGNCIAVVTEGQAHAAAESIPCAGAVNQDTCEF